MKEKFLMNIPKELKDFLQKEAKNKGYSMNALILKMMWEYMEKNGKET